MPTVIGVPLSQQPYDVVVGSGAVDALGTLLPPRAKRAVIVTQAEIGIEVDSGLPQEVFTIPQGEAHKSLATIESLCSAFARFGLTRADVVIGVGGGLVTDVAAFAAASYHRGTAVTHVSTSLLGQVDAAIGGKCGVNLPEGKNLVGAFHQPSGVICDTDHLGTLPPAEMLSGLGEVAKYHFLGGGALDLCEMDERVARCVQIKSDVVVGDERELTGLRATLNYGHTLAHAIETAGTYGLKHGEAVAIGLVYAAEVAHRLGRINADRVAEHRRVLAAYDLRSELPAELGDDDLLALFTRDKKAIDGVTLVLDGDDGVEVVTPVDPGVLRDALSALR